MTRPLVIGLTGGIGSGKSSVSELFRALGVPVIDTDLLAREVVRPGRPAHDRIVSEFGSDIIDENGHLRRDLLRQRIYRDEELKRRLESIIHPDIIMEMDRRISDLDCPYCVVVIPLLLEAGLAGRVDRVLVVDTGEDSQVDRVIRRDGLSEQEIRSIMDTQASRRERTGIADDVIDNSGAVEDLQQQVEDLHSKYLSLAGSTGHPVSTDRR